jgi:hypothetical protein
MAVTNARIKVKGIESWSADDGVVLDGLNLKKSCFRGVQTLNSLTHEEELLLP